MSGVPVECRGVTHVYRTAEGREGDADVPALDQLDLDVRAGESVAVLGASGSGKSTLLLLLAGLLRPTAGRLAVDGQDVARLSERALLRLRARQIGVVLQGPGRNLLPYETAFGNVRFAARGRRVPVAAHRDLLDRLGLTAVAGQRAGSLSGGEQQRLALAVALARDPGLLLVDEPTSQLDAGSRDDVVALLRAVHAERGVTVVAVTHDEGLAAALGRTVRLHDGRADDESPQWTH